MKKYVLSSWQGTVERMYPDGFSTVRAVIGARRDLPLGANVPDRSPLFSFGVAELPPGGQIEKHAHHDREEVFYILEGTGTLTVDGDVVEFGEGQAVWFDQGCEHLLINTGDVLLRCLFVGIVPHDVAQDRRRKVAAAS